MRRAFEVTILTLLFTTTAQAQTSRPAFTLSKIDGPIVKEFQKAWHLSGSGSSDLEGVVLIFRNADGSYRAVTLARTNESRKVTFRWDSGIIAIIHTHPRRCNPEPHGQDIPLADRFGVPIFTLTLKGMFMYDPGTKRISKVKDWLDWLDLSKWEQSRYLATEEARIN